MARYTGPRARLCRRLEFPVFESPKFGNIRKNYPPGQQGQGRRRKLSNYGIQLREKQRIKYLYGVLEKASGGILLIDEVSEIPLETQAKILRVLTDQKFKRINGNRDINVNVRIICTSSKDIRKEIEDGNFREDLYHRLNVVPITLEPLKNRTEDIPLLIDYFSKTISESYGIPKLEIDTNNPYLFEYDWPGNVRELRNLVERIAILSPNEKNENINMIINESLKKVSIKK